MSSLYPATAPQVGINISTNVVYALGKLKGRFPGKIPREDLVNSIFPVQQRLESTITLFLQKMKNNPRIRYNKEDDAFIFRPLHDITDGDSLLAYLQKQDSALGIAIGTDLRDGWPSVEEGVTKLEAEHRLLVVRNKKDQHARHVWLDDPTLQGPLDDEFKEEWRKIALPDKDDDIIKELRKMNHKSTGEVTVQDVGVQKKKKAKNKRRGTKITNTHMLRDYSTPKKESDIKRDPGVKTERR